jgi:hypothetical protein
MRKAGPIVLVSALILISVFSTLSFSTVADPVPEITIEAPSEIEIEVEPGSGGRATIYGNVTCQSNNPEDVYVRLIAKHTHGGCAINPLNFLFENVGTESKQFRIIINVPMLTSSYEKPTVTINCSWSQGAQSGTLEPFTIQVKVLPYYRLTVFSIMPVIETTPGDSETFELRLENTGNIDDIYSLEIVNLQDLNDYGISIDPLNQVSLVEGGNDIINVNVYTSSDTKVRVYQIHAICTSIGSGGVYKGEYMMYLRVISNPVQIITSPIVLILICIVLIMIIVYYIRRRKMVNLS